MIGKVRTGSSFGGLSGYLMHGKTPSRDREPGLQDYLLEGKGGDSRVEWTDVRNLPTDDPHLAAEMMRATAEQNTRVKKPVYHVSLSAEPGEHLTRERWNQVVDRVLAGMDLEEHQVVVVAHNDTEHPHVHLMVNRVHPDHHKAWSNSHDYYRMEKTLRHVERDMNLREVPGHHYQLEGQTPPQREGKTTSGERQHKERTGGESWAERVRFQVYNDLKEAENWGDLERRLAGHGLRLQRRGGGLVLTDGEHRVKASRIYRRGSYSWLEKRFGMSFEEWRGGRRELLEAIDRHQQTERKRRDLARLEENAHAAYTRALDQVDHREKIRTASKDTARAIQREFRELYRPEEQPKVRRRFMADVRTRGWEAAAESLARRPRRYGRPRVSWLKKRKREILGRRIVSYARDMSLLRGARLLAGPAGHNSIAAALTARRTWLRTRRRREDLPATKTQLTEIAGRVAALGASAVALTLSPRPLQVVRVALRTVELARAVARELER